MNSRLLVPVVFAACAAMGIGRIIYNFAQNSITDLTVSDSSVSDSFSSLSTQEIDAFNNQFTSYSGEQTGSNVRALMGRLIGNADTYKDETSKVPQVYIDKLSEDMLEEMYVTYIEFDDGDVTNYINDLGKIRNNVETKHSYYVDFTYQTNGLIDYIQISYDPENPILDYYHR